MRGNTIHLFMSPGRVRESMPLWQYDYGQILIIDGIELPAAYEVHFATDENGNSVTQIGNENGVSIPDALLQSGKPIHVWLYVHTGLEDGETEVHGVIPVARRAKPTNSTPTPVQQDAITEAIAALNAAVAEAEELADGIPGMINNALEAAKASGEFDGFSPVVEITSISGGYRVSITDATGTYTADIMNGQPGKPGDDGYSPTVTITNITGGHRITITDKTGDHSADVMDGEDGDDGISPTVAITEITGGHRVTITDANGDHVFDVLDGYGDTSIIAPDYSDLTFPVAEGSPCVKDNVLYFAKEAIQTSEPWTASHWLAAPNVGTELTSLKNALNQSNAATNSDIGKAHSPKTVVDGKVTEWQYLDLNDYVTPEMFGAKGDGTTDDSEAIQDMFDSESNSYVFANKTYLVNGSVDVDNACNIYFNNTTLKAGASSAIRDFEYVIAFNTPQIHTHGQLTVECQKSVNIGIYLNGCGNSVFDTFVVTSARIWGISTNMLAAGANGMSFNSILVARCGYKAYAKAKYSTSKILNITDISCTGSYFNNIKEELFANTYRQSEIIIDDSGYIDTYNYSGVVWDIQHNRRVFWPNSGNPFALDEQDTTKGTFTYPSGNAVPSNYADGESGRNVLIPIGGGINLQSSTSEGAYIINKLVTQSNPVGARLMLPYGGHIGLFASEYDTMVMMTNAMGLDISVLYNEATGNGFNYKFNNGYDEIICMTFNASPNVFVGSSNIQMPFVQGNCVVVGRQSQMLDQLTKNPLRAPQFVASRKCFGIVINWANGNSTMEVNEYTPSEMTIESPGFNSSKNHITIGLYSENAFEENRFQPMHLFIRSRTHSDSSRFNITLKQQLIMDGYSIDGAVDNVYSISPSEYDDYFEVTIILFPYQKKFYVHTEKIFKDLVTSLNSSSTDAQYPSAKCVYDLLGDVETLLAGI